MILILIFTLGSRVHVLKRIFIKNYKIIDIVLMLNYVKIWQWIC